MFNSYANAAGLPAEPTHYHDLVALALFALVFMITVLSFEKGRYREQLLNISWTITSLLIVVFQMKSAIKNIHQGVFWYVSCRSAHAFFYTYTSIFEK